MTLGEIKGFLKAIEKRNRVDKASFISGVALGAQGSGKDIGKHIKRILGE